MTYTSEDVDALAGGRDPGYLVLLLSRVYTCEMPWRQRLRIAWAVWSSPYFAGRSRRRKRGRRLAIAVFAVASLILFAIAIGAIAGVGWCRPIANTFGAVVVAAYLLGKARAAARWIRRWASERGSEVHRG